MDAAGDGSVCSLVVTGERGGGLMCTARLRVAEFYAGVGGLHYALLEALRRKDGEGGACDVAAFDLSPHGAWRRVYLSVRSEASSLPARAPAARCCQRCWRASCLTAPPALPCAHSVRDV